VNVEHELREEIDMGLNFVQCGVWLY